MYLISVLLLMGLLPVGSIGVEYFCSHSPLPLPVLVGKWFVFWSAGVRLFLAGLRQFFQPRFTAEKIFGLHGVDALPIVRELGVANFVTGTTGMLSLALPGFVLPMAVIATLFYGIAGVRHATDRARNRNQQIAMVSDLLAALVFAVYLGFAAFA